MNRNQLFTALLSFSLLGAAGCSLFNTADGENARGSGSTAFNPYQGARSGALNLHLVHYNGCAIDARGEPLAPGLAKIPYPNDCPSPNAREPLEERVEPTSRMRLITDTNYFLGRFTAIASVHDAHSDYEAATPAVSWMTEQSPFKDLDWSSLTRSAEEWHRTVIEGNFVRELAYEAAWMRKFDDTLLLEVLDVDGRVRASKVIRRDEFMTESRLSGHSRASWFFGDVGAPSFYGDTKLNPAADGRPAYSRTMVRVDFAVAANPFDSFRLPELSGDGAIRVTWSQLPQVPFYFPVEFIEAEDIEPSCYVIGEDGLATDEPTVCSFGLEQDVRFNRPANGEFYEPGETVEFILSLRDGESHGLHPRETLPSYADYQNGTSNGLLYVNGLYIDATQDNGNLEAGWRVAGPIQDLRYTTAATNEPPYFVYPERTLQEPHAVLGLIQSVPGLREAPNPTRFKFTLPQEAKPGTYQLVVKSHRHFLGERVNRMTPFYFQVGQKQGTLYPNRIGNCQICHRGVFSMENMMHGASVDMVEGCKTCHMEREGETPMEFTKRIHKLHMNSPKYLADKADCNLCHLTRESTAVSSMVACGSCHPDAHGDEFHDLAFAAPTATPNGYSNCATGCHEQSLPNSHILPSQE